MDFATIVKRLIKDAHKNQAWLAEQIGLAGASSVNKLFIRNNPTIKTLFDICEVFDYEITIQPKRKRGVRPDGQFVITPADKNNEEESK